jgi:hypothetical protein
MVIRSSSLCIFIGVGIGIALRSLLSVQLVAAQSATPTPAPPSAAMVESQVAAQPSADSGTQNATPPAPAPTPATSAQSTAPNATPAAPEAKPFLDLTPTDDSLEERLDALSQKVDGLSHLRISGFVQAQYVRNDASGEGLDSNGKPLNKDVFEVRRARLRATYTLGLAEFVVNLDAIPAGVTVKEAEMSLTIPWSDKVQTKLTAGLMYIPFGYDTQESDSVLPFIERSTTSNRLFPGQRDIGLRAAGTLFDRAFEYQFAVMNGNPQSDAVFPAQDPNATKDVIGRVGINVAGLRAGVSALVGKGFLPPAVDDPKTTGLDETRAYRDFPHRAAGFDVTYQLPLPVIGNLTLYVEGVIAHNLDRSTLGDYPKPPIVEVDGKQVYGGGVAGSNQLGGYVGFLQQLTKYAAIGARGEIFDPSTSKANNSLGALSMIAHAYPVELVRLTVAYQLSYENPTVKNNQFWLRGQVKF